MVSGIWRGNHDAKLSGVVTSNVKLYWLPDAPKLTFKTGDVSIT
jgi:hypothetical protein